MNLTTLISIDNFKIEALKMTGKKKLILRKINFYGPTNLYPYPTYLKEIRLNDRIIPLNSSFINSNEKDRLKTRIIVNFKDYYNLDKFKCLPNHSCYSLNITTSSPNRKGSDYYDD